MNERLMAALLSAAVFFETSADGECDPDLAVKQLEQIAAELRELSDEEQEQFRAFAQRVAAADPRPDMSRVIVELVDGLLGQRAG